MTADPGGRASLSTISPQGYWMTFADHRDQDQRLGHVALGPHSIPGAHCENCDRPLHRLLSLDVRDPRLGLASMPFTRLHLLSCPTCEERPRPFFYGIREDDSVAVFKHGWGGRSEQFPYPDYPDHFPARALSFAEVTPPEQEILRQINQRGPNFDQFTDLYEDELGVIRHQYGGEPFLIQLTENPACPLCGKAMPIVAALGDEIAPEPGFHANCGVQMLWFLCPRCAVVAAVEECD